MQNKLYKASFSVGARLDCNGNYSISLELLDKNRMRISSHKKRGVADADINWKEVVSTIHLSQAHAIHSKYLKIIIRGKDRRFRMGHYGTKLTRISVTVKFAHSV